MLRLGTLFTGIGAPEQGAKRVYDDLELVFSCEFDKFARESFKANYEIEDKHFHTDVNDMDGKQYQGKVDILIGGSPCQAFSIAGLRDGLNDKRGQLIWQYYRIIMEVQPPIFIYENVKGMVSDNNGQTLRDFETVFRESGYFCHKAVINTKDYGVPQNRERIYIVWFKDADLYHRFQFAPKVKLEKRLKDVLESDVDEKYYLSEDMVKGFVAKGNDEGHINQDIQASSVFSTEKESPSLCAGTHGYAQGYIKDLNRVNRTLRCGGGSSLTDKHCFDLIQVKSATKAGYETATTGDSINLTHPDSKTRRGRVGAGVAQTLDCACNQAVVEPSIEVIGSTGGGHEANSRIYGVDGLSPSLMAGNNGGGQSPVKHLTQDNRIRKLTPRECLRLQDFPDTFKQVVSNSQQYKQAGNSMSINMLEMIFKQIEKAKTNHPTNTLMDFL